MSKLNFSPLSEAFNLGSDQIKNTKEEIAKLKELISDSSLKDSSKKSKNGTSSIIEKGSSEKSEINNSSSSSIKTNDFKRIGNPDNLTLNLNLNGQNLSSNVDDDTLILKLVNSPKFEDIVKNYIIVKHPEWIGKSVRSTSYTNVSYPNNVNSFESFGNKYNNTVCSNINHYIIFFVIMVSIYLLLKNLIPGNS